MPKKPKATIHRIIVDRLYNLGNYEHVKYSMGVDIPPGASPKEALLNTVQILKALNPRPPCQEYEYRNAQDVLKAPDESGKNVQSAKKVVRLYQAWEKRRERALALLDKFGGTQEYKDAKLSWDNDYEDP